MKINQCSNFTLMQGHNGKKYNVMFSGSFLNSVEFHLHMSLGKAFIDLAVMCNW